ncbi:sugar phosphate isomerase/epimerase [Rothia sp. AR01]|uniref:Sugar phosphate isomerase/epimerase n=1 Tax=Rothia santali TaxID=2949643 RepID=A0A9X2KJ72_9MICC|nr:sugar phosphate isomerase/epimerase [Rothia santali]MCP3426564.1 sugar phosphate isomerase/epimerase [Rothia santali]
MTHHKIAAAPISWGVCEVPGWGHQIDSERVLAEMGELGFTATEFGPEGFLPEDPARKAEVLSAHGLRAVGGFVPVVLHDPGTDPAPAIERELAGYRSAGAGTLVLAAATGVDGYDAARPVLDDAGWQTLFGNVDRIVALAEAAGVAVALHPHVGTMVETREDLERVLAGSSVPICFDTGHLFIGGGGPGGLAREHPPPASPAGRRPRAPPLPPRGVGGPGVAFAAPAVVLGLEKPEPRADDGPGHDQRDGEDRDRGQQRVAAPDVPPLGLLRGDLLVLDREAAEARPLLGLGGREETVQGLALVAASAAAP